MVLKIIKIFQKNSRFIGIDRRRVLLEGILEQGQRWLWDTELWDRGWWGTGLRNIRLADMKLWGWDCEAQHCGDETEVWDCEDQTLRYTIVSYGTVRHNTVGTALWGMGLWDACSACSYCCHNGLTFCTVCGVLACQVLSLSTDEQ